MSNFFLFLALKGREAVDFITAIGFVETFAQSEKVEKEHPAVAHLQGKRKHHYNAESQ